MTLYAAWQVEQYPTHSPTSTHSSTSTDHIFTGHAHTPLFGQIICPAASSSVPPRGTIIATYGIVGSLGQQKALSLLRDKAVQLGYTLIQFDWRAHGKTATLSPTLTSDGLYEGKDFIHIAVQAKALGCPPPYWFTGYSLGGQLALWGIHPNSLALAESLGLSPDDIGGAAVICPNLDSNRSLDFLVSSLQGRWLEQSIARSLKDLAKTIQSCHPEHMSDGAIARANSIREFDEHLVIPRLGFASVEDYYTASSPLPWLDTIEKPALILYAADDPMFHPGIVDDLRAIAQRNSNIHLYLTPWGGHVGYYSSDTCQQQWGDADPWWAWNRIIDWCGQDHQ